MLARIRLILISNSLTSSSGIWAFGVGCQGKVGAAEKYAGSTCFRGDMERRCRKAGVVLQAFILEKFRGVSVEVEGGLTCFSTKGLQM